MGGDEAMKLASVLNAKIHSVKGMSGSMRSCEQHRKIFREKGIKPLIWADMLGNTWND